MMRPPATRARPGSALASTTLSTAGGDQALISRRPRSAASPPSGSRPGWDVKVRRANPANHIVPARPHLQLMRPCAQGKMADEKRKVSVLKAQLAEKDEELQVMERKLREANESVADFEKMLDGLYTRLEAKETECRELQDETTSNREQIGRLTTTLDSLRREHDSLVASADTLSGQIISQKREQVRDTIQLYMAQMPSTLHKYRYVELQGKLDALFVSPAS